MISPFLLALSTVWISRYACAEDSLESPTVNDGIIHDADFNILKAQRSTEWETDDALVEEKLSDFRRSNGNRPPNILHILIDGIGFGDLGIPELNAIRGYKTPNINKFARESMRFARFYTEPSCTPTRVAFLTGRQPHRNGMANTKVTISGFGLAAKEVTLAEILSDAGYRTAHVGKWHMGDIKEAWPNFQGFDWAAFPIHQQGPLSFFHVNSANEEVVIGMGTNNYDDRFTLDEWFRPNSSTMVAGVEGTKGEEVSEVNMEDGEIWDEDKYEEMNFRYQQQALEQLTDLATQPDEKPFFLEFWPLYPLTGPRVHKNQRYTTPNGGHFVEKMQLVDEWVGDISDEVDRLDVADNTIVVVMADNGHFTGYSPLSGFSPMIYRGGKGTTSEGGVRVDAFVRWPGVIPSGSIVSDIVHVADLFTSLARFGDATEHIPRDRIIDGVDQTALMLVGETHGRRDTVFLYVGDVLKAVVKEQFKYVVPEGGGNPIAGTFYDLFRDTREEYPVSFQIGTWGGDEFGRIVDRHTQRMAKYPREGPATGIPYDGITNLRPESMAAVAAFTTKKNAVLV